MLRCSGAEYSKLSTDARETGYDTTGVEDCAYVVDKSSKKPEFLDPCRGLSCLMCGKIDDGPDANLIYVSSLRRALELKEASVDLIEEDFLKLTVNILGSVVGSEEKGSRLGEGIVVVDCRVKNGTFEITFIVEEYWPSSPEYILEVRSSNVCLDTTILAR